VRDRDKLVSDSPHTVGDVFITFRRHNQGRNWRRVYFNRVCWILILAVLLEFQTTDDIATAINKWEKLVAWENNPRKRGRIIAKVRVTELIDIPRSIRWSEGEVLEEDSWTSSVEIIQQGCRERAQLMKIPFLLLRLIRTHCLCNHLMVSTQLTNLEVIWNRIKMMMRKIGRKRLTGLFNSLWQYKGIRLSRKRWLLSFLCRMESVASLLLSQFLTVMVLLMLFKVSSRDMRK
jgi:hypothetical protein